MQAVLDRAALAASRQPAVRADAFVYTQSVTDGSDTFDVPPRLRPAGRKEVRSWLSVDGRHGALIQSRRAGTNGPWQDDIVVPPGCAGALAPTPSPAPAAGTAGAVTCTPSGVTPDLPTTTDAMLAWLYAHGSDGHGPDQHPSRDARAWNAATDLLGEYLSPPTQAALFRALGRIPGVYLIPGARDEAGRLDVAVARRSGHVRDQVFFDPSTSAYRGVERRLVADDFLGRAGSLLYAVAVTDQAIVASIRQLP